MTFQLDTSGDVGPMPAGPMNEGFLKWSDLSPFTQGYIEALFASAATMKTYDGRIGAKTAKVRNLAFSDLAPETLDRIIADCEERNGPIMEAGGVSLIGAGEMFWNDRQRGFLGERFPPLTGELGDDGLVRFV